MAAVRVCATADVPAGEARRFAVDGREVAVVNLGDDGFRAIDAVCSHERFFLDEGDVDPDLGTIECPKHGSTFDLETGRPRSLPATKPVAVHPVRLDGGAVWIDITTEV
jgi:3-phenylpropionate/trans-cinnamate dioxygenase ferredoxin subunit